MMRVLKKVVKFFPNKYIQLLCWNEYKNQKSLRFNERPVEYGFVFKKLYEFYPKSVLDIGTGTTALPHLIRNCGFHVTAIDNIKDYWPDGMINRHFHVINDDITNTKIGKKFDFITCISTLEHIHQFDVAVKNMFSLLNDDGHLIITCPYSDSQYVQNVYDLPKSSYGKGNPYIAQSYSQKEITKWLVDNNGVIVEQEFWQFWTGEFWTVDKQVIPPKCVSRSERHQLTCMVLRKARKE